MSGSSLSARNTSGPCPQGIDSLVGPMDKESGSESLELLKAPVYSEFLPPHTLQIDAFIFLFQAS